MTRKEEIEQASIEYQMSTRPMALGGDAFADMIYRANINPSFIAGAEWADSHAWKDAQGDDLPEIDREVIVLVEEYGHYKVCFAHRPVESYTGVSITNHSEMEEYYPERYDKGMWNIPNVKYWLDLELPVHK